MRKKYSRSESTTYFRKFKVDHVRGIHHPKELSVNTAPNTAKWPPCHVKLLLVICAILLNRWWILIYYFFTAMLNYGGFIVFGFTGGTVIRVRRAQKNTSRTNRRSYCFCTRFYRTIPSCSSAWKFVYFRAWDNPKL